MFNNTKGSASGGGSIMAVIEIIIGISLLPTLLSYTQNNPQINGSTAIIVGLMGLVFAGGLIYDALRKFGLAGKK